MADQRAMWNKAHAANDHIGYGFEARELATIAAKYLVPSSAILELGCGIGADAHYFSEQGHEVTATDFSETVVEQNIRRWHDGVKFQVLDLSVEFPFDDLSFDAVYANLSLHYFTDEKTKEIVSEIARILANEGLLVFSCKSLKDPKYGEGTVLGHNIFERNGHIRHFFSAEYCREILQDQFTIIELTEGAHEYIGESSAFVYCIAKKTG